MRKKQEECSIIEAEVVQETEELETEVVEISSFLIWLDTKCMKIEKELKDLFDKGKNVKFIYPEIITIFKILNVEKKQLSECGSDIEAALDKFQDIIALINRNAVFVPEIENFSIFMGWTSRKYKQMAQSTDEEIREAMELVDDYIFACQYNAGQSGILKGNLTKFRSQLSGSHGQGVVTSKESSDINKNVKQEKSQEQLLKELSRMGFDTQLPDNRKK